MTFTDELQRLPAQAISAVRVLRMVDDPNASTADLARLVETDPALSAQVMRLANSPYYGLSNSIASAGRAVVLLGFTTVRALAVTAACGLMVGDAKHFPPGFWPHGVATAVGAAAVARRTGVPKGDAFSAGLLHDVGTALLYKHDQSAYEQITTAATEDPQSLSTLERAHFGSTHAEVGGEVLESWRFPPAFVRALRNHHRPLDEVDDSLAKIVIVGEALGHEVDPSAAHEPAVPIDVALAAVGLEKVPLRELTQEMKQEIAGLAQFLEIER